MPRMPLFGPFADLEDQVDARLRQVDDLRRHGGRDAARAAIELDDAADVLLRLGAGEDAARAHRHLVAAACRSLMLEFPSNSTWLMIGFSTTCTIRVSPCSWMLHVGEQVGAGQRLQRQVELGRVDRVADLDRQVGEDGVLLDALVALHDDAPDDAALLLPGRAPARGPERADSRRRPAAERNAREQRRVCGRETGHRLSASLSR